MNAWTFVLIAVIVVLVALPAKYDPIIYLREWFERHKP